MDRVYTNCSGENYPDINKTQKVYNENIMNGSPENQNGNMSKVGKKTKSNITEVKRVTTVVKSVRLLCKVHFN